MPGHRVRMARVAAAAMLLSAPAFGRSGVPEPAVAQGEYRLYLPVVELGNGGTRPELHLASQVGGRTSAIVADGRRAWAGIGPRVVAFEIDADDSVRLVGASDVLPGVVEDLVLAGDRVAAITNALPYLDGTGLYSGVHVFDVAPSGTPRLVGSLLGLAPRLSHVAASTEALFVTDPFRTVWAVDVSDPARPRVESTVEIPSRGESELRDAVWHADHLYVLQYDDDRPDEADVVRLAVMDAASAAELEAPSTVPLSQDAGMEGTLQVDRGRLYCWGGSKLEVLDLADPDHPVEIPNALWAAEPATVADHRMYMSLDDSGGLGTDAGSILVLDVTDPMSPTVLGTANVGLWPMFLAAGDDVLFGGGSGVGGAVVSDPAVSTAAGACRMPAGETGHVAVGDTGLYAPERSGLWHWPASAEADIGCAARVDIGWTHLGPMAVAGERGLVGEWGVSPARVVAVELPSAGPPRFGGRSADLPFLADVAAEGDYAFALSERGLHVIDGRDVDAPLLRDSIELVQSWRWGQGAVAVRDGLVAVAGPEVRLFDMTDPERPRPLGALGPTEARDVVLHGRLAFVSGSVTGGCPSGGLHVIDVGDRLAPRLVSEDCSRRAGPLAVADAPPHLGEGSLVFVGDLASPSRPPAVWAYLVPPSGRTPVPLATTLLPANPEDMVVSADGTHLWVADRDGGLIGYEPRWSQGAPGQESDLLAVWPAR